MRAPVFVQSNEDDNDDREPKKTVGSAEELAEGVSNPEGEAVGLAPCLSSGSV